MKNIEIPLSKTKITYTIIGSLLFVITGIWFLTDFADLQTRFSPVLIRNIGVLSVFVFGLILVFTLKKYFDKTPGLILTENGIIDNSSAVSIGLIEWKDITKIRTVAIMSTKIVLIDTNNPEKYLAKASGFKARLMRVNYNSYGTPLSIASTTLQYDFYQLEQLLQGEFQKNS